MRTKALRKTRETQLYAMAGFITGVIVIAQMNIDEMLRWDRFQHTAVSLCLFLFFFMVLKGDRRQWFYALAMAFLFGLIKEFTDPQAQGFDIIANLFGILLGFIILWLPKIFTGHHHH